MHRAAGEPREADVARDLDRFGGGGDARQAKAGGELALGRGAAGRQRRLFRMLHDAGAETARVGQRQAHQAGGARARGDRR